MARGLLVIVGVALVGWGGLYWLGLREAGYNPAVPTTVAQILADFPCGSERNFQDSRSKHVRLDGIEADIARVVKSPFDDVWSYVPVKGTQDKLYLEIWRTDAPPPGPITVFGDQMHSPSGSLPPQLETQAKQGGLFLVSYENRNYYASQRSNAIPYFILGGGVVALAALLQSLIVLGRVWDKRKLAQAGLAATMAPGPCTLCNTTVARIPVYIEAQKRRIAGPHTARITSTSVWADCCPACYVRLGKLWRVSTVGQMALPPLLMFFIFSVIMLSMTGLALLGLGCAVGLFFVLQYWINRRYDRMLGPLHAQLKQAINVSMWNPLADKITYGKRFVDVEKTLPEQRKE